MEVRNVIASGRVGSKEGLCTDMGLQAGENVGASWDAREVEFGCERGCMPRCKVQTVDVIRVRVDTR